MIKQEETSLLRPPGRVNFNEISRMYELRGLCNYRLSVPVLHVVLPCREFNEALNLPFPFVDQHCDASHGIDGRF